MQQAISSQNLQHLNQNVLQLNKSARVSPISKFLHWCEKQEDNRFLWLGVALMGNMGMVLPLTVVTVLMASPNNFMLFILAAISNVPVLAVNLAAQPTKITLPILFFGWLVNVVIIGYSLATILFA